MGIFFFFFLFAYFFIIILFMSATGCSRGFSKIIILGKPSSDSRPAIGERFPASVLQINFRVLDLSKNLIYVLMI